MRIAAPQAEEVQTLLQHVAKKEGLEIPLELQVKAGTGFAAVPPAFPCKKSAQSAHMSLSVPQPVRTVQASERNLRRALLMGEVLPYCTDPSGSQARACRSQTGRCSSRYLPQPASICSC